jgi:WD40 repeat protein
VAVIGSGGAWQVDDGFVRCVAFSPDGRWVVSSETCRKYEPWVVNHESNKIRVRDASTLRQVAVLEGHTGPVACLAFSPDGKTLVSAAEDYSVRLWQFEGSRVVPTFVLREYVGVAVPNVVRVSPDGRTLVVVYVHLPSPPPMFVMPRFLSSKQEPPPRLYNLVRLWDLSGNTPTCAGFLQSDDFDAFFAPDVRRLITVDRNSARVWDATRWPHSSDEMAQAESWWNASTRWFLLIGLTGVFVVVFVLYVVLVFPNKQSTVRGPDRDRARRESRRFLWRACGTGAVLATAALLLIWCTWPSGTEGPKGVPTPIGTIRSGSVTTAAVSTDGRTLALAREDGTMLLHQLGEGQVGDVQERELRHERNIGQVTALTFAADGRLMASAGKDGTIRLWTIGQRPEERAVLRGHMRMVTCVAFARDALVSGSRDGTIRLWDPTGEESREKIPCRVGNAFLLGDGKTLAETHTLKNAVCLWDLTGKKPALRPELKGYEFSVVDVQMSPDRRILATLEQSGISDSPDNPLPDLTAELLYGSEPTPNPTAKPVEFKNVLRLWNLSGAEPRLWFKSPPRERRLGRPDLLSESARICEGRRPARLRGRRGRRTALGPQREPPGRTRDLAGQPGWQIGSPPDGVAGRQGYRRCARQQKVSLDVRIWRLGSPAR